MEEGFKYFKPAGGLNSSLEELLKSPDAKDLAIAHLEYLEPEKGRELARMLLWTDSAFSFGLLGQLPRGLNFATAFLDELGWQLQKVPPHLMREFAAEMGRNIDTASIMALPRAYAPLLKGSAATSSEFSTLFPPGETAKALNSFLYSYNRRRGSKPVSSGELIAQYLGQIDQEELSTAILRSSDQVAGSLAANPTLSRSVFRSLLKIFWGALKGSLRRGRKADRRPG